MFLPVDVEQAVTLVVDLGGHLADAEADVAAIRDLAADLELQVERIEVLRAHLSRPPQARVRQLRVAGTSPG